MRRLIVFLLAVTAGLSAQNGAPQSPRQALIEMLRSPDQVDRHLPEALRAALAKIPEEQRSRQMREMAAFATLLSASPNMQMFETGPVLAVLRDPKDDSRIEITVESDDLSGDTDQMEFGLRIHNQGQEQDLGFGPHVQITMKLQGGVWRLAGIGFRISLDFENPKLLNQIVKSASTKEGASNKAYGVGALIPSGGSNGASSQNVAIIGVLRTLNTAQAVYASTYPEIGFTCQLSHLGGSLSSGEINAQAAKLIDPALESGRKFGYRISLSGCGNTPNSAYRVSAIPMGQMGAPVVYCTDNTGVIRMASGSDGGYCLANGTPVQ